MNIAGIFRRLGSTWINRLLCIVTIGIYLIFIIINYCKAKPNIGQKAVGISYGGDCKMGKLFGFGILAFFFKCLIIPFIIEFIKIILKKGTFAESWSKTYLVA